MFDRIGEQIKKWAKAVCILGIIVSAIIGFAPCFSKLNLETVIYGIAVLIGGSCASWVGTCLIYGFGELIEETTRNRETNDKILRLLSERKEQNQIVLNRQNAEENRKAKQHTAQIEETERPVVKSNGRWLCKKCAMNNSADDLVCPNCGQPQ